MPPEESKAPDTPQPVPEVPSPVPAPEAVQSVPEPNPVPVETARKMGSDIVIGVNLNNHYSFELLDRLNFLSVARHSFSIMMHNIADYEIQKADIAVIPKVDDIHWKTLLQTKNKLEGIHAGEQAMEEEITSLKIIIKSKLPFIPVLLEKLKKIFK